MSANSGMNLGVIVNSDSAGNDCPSNADASLTAKCVDTKSGLESSGTMVSASSDDGQTVSVVSSTAYCVAGASTATVSIGLMPASFVTAASQKAGDSAGPFRLVIAANSLRPAVPKTSTHVVSGLGHPTLLVGPAVTVPSCAASSRKMVTVLPAGVNRSPSQAPVAIINARPLAAAGQTASFAARSPPAKVTVLSLPKTSSIPGQFVTVVPSSGSTAALSTTSGETSKAAAVPYKVLIRPPSAVSI